MGTCAVPILTLFYAGKYGEGLTNNLNNAKNKIIVLLCSLSL